MSEETGEVNEDFKVEIDCPDSTSCVLATYTLAPAYDYGESKEYRIKS